jgi:hypothetical protein
VPRVGVSEYEVSLEKQEVFVTGAIPYDDLLAKIKKTGKEVRPRRPSSDATNSLRLVQVRSGQTLS